jgi:hypothetical protein
MSVWLHHREKDIQTMDEPDERLCSCNAGCGWSGPAKDLGCQFHQITDFFERVSPGETVPVGECPICGALASLTPWLPLTVAAPDTIEGMN